MSIIHTLSENLIDKIAAGEVIERPASVVKELIENALDAGADEIRIHIQDGGKRLIEIADNGRGMGAKDILICCDRHTTSKIKNDYDLFSISTFGFRGEALSSIASVSNIKILSGNGEEAHQKVWRFGDPGKLEPGESIRGTTVSVSHLFKNVPVPRKIFPSDRCSKLNIFFSFKKRISALDGCTFTSTSSKFIFINRTP